MPVSRVDLRVTTGDATGVDDGPKLEIDRDAVFDLLSSSRRRYVLFHLCNGAPTVHITELARELAAVEMGVDPATLSETDVRRVYISLYQTHIPKLEAHGLVSFDPDERLVELAGDEETLRVACGLLGVERADSGPSLLAGAGCAMTSIAVVVALAVAATGTTGATVWIATAAVTVLAANAVVARQVFGGPSTDSSLRNRQFDRV